MDTTLENKEKADTPSIWLALIFAVLVIAVIGLNWYFVHPLANRGTFGDMFGAANSVFTGLAFVGVVYAIRLQHHEVGLLNTELQISKSMVRKQQELAEQQIVHLNVQQFEGSFFNFFNVFVGLVEKIEIREGATREKYTGKGVLSSMLYDVDGTLSNDTAISSEAAYEKLYETQNSVLGHYFRTLSNLVKLVDSSSITNKRLYTNLIRAQLTDDEVMLLY
ncbi:putative phage abortive infection protein [Falsihalocynthiibacter sp. SS001]|uniref:putative phage abortive infection protein n=1 Tax=Falsihalocynthiibacter sp. SS001 TaxID=3349698 RepID=UPI0036D3E3BD